MKHSIEYEVVVHDEEDGSLLWAEIPELPGLFVSGENDEELAEALAEAVPLYLTDAGQKPFKVTKTQFGAAHSSVLVDC